MKKERFKTCLYLDLDKCTADADCEAADANKECSAGSCVCKAGHYSDINGKCVTGTSKLHVILQYGLPIENYSHSCPISVIKFN